MSIDSENDLFKQLVNSSIPNLIERSQFNKRRRKLFEFSEGIRTTLACSFLEFENYFIIDSMPLEICKKARQNRIKICKKDFETAPSKGFCASQDTWFYGTIAGRGEGSAGGDTWTWDGTDWTQLEIGPGAPGRRGGPSMITAGDRVILFGGHNFNVDYYGDAWTWNGMAWSRVDRDPQPRPRGK